MDKILVISGPISGSRNRELRPWISERGPVRKVGHELYRWRHRQIRADRERRWRDGRGARSDEKPQNVAGRCERTPADAAATGRREKAHSAAHVSDDIL